MPSTNNVPPSGGRGPGLAANGRRLSIIATATAAVAALVGPEIASGINGALDDDEGNRLVAYLDSVRIWTGCRGVIRIDGRPIPPRYRFTPAECAELNSIETVRHLQGVLRAVPALRGGCPAACERPNTIIAATRLTYNIGVAGFARSTVARRMNAGDWAGACAAFGAFNKGTINGRRVIIRGLVLRRDREMRQCRLDLRPAAGRRP